MKIINLISGPRKRLNNLNLLMNMNIESKLDSDLNLKKVIKTIKKSKIDTYLVGGYVRDLFLNRDCKDIDFMTIGDPFELVKKISNENNFSSVRIFKNFGTASISNNKYQYEFVRARKESYSRDSRNPSVSEGSFEDDINRRDFTINSMAISVNKDYGKLIDNLKGIDDLKNKIIKTCDEPNKTFEDDPLRMMRAIRFATQLNFDIEPNTFQAIKDSAERIKIISMERISSELNKIILSKNPSYGFKLLFTTNLLNFFFPEMKKLHGVDKISRHGHKDNFYHTLEVLDNVSRMSDSLWLRWSAVLHDIAKPLTKRYNEKSGWTFHGHEDLGAKIVPKIFRNLKLPLNEKMKYVQKLVKLHLRPIALVNNNITNSALRRLLFEAGEDIQDLMLLCRADITTKNPEKATKYLRNFDIVEKKMELVEETDKLKNFQPPVSGEEIINIFAIKPSKVVGILKNEIKEQILDGKIKNNKKEALDLLVNLGKSHGLKPIK
jgi:poly(A) polymerase|tara:strand:- start:218 stop:1696 length:1479 start_codon:yes stop_codon:yes gene_type:complete